METEQSAGSCPAPGQAAVRTWLPSSTRASKTPGDAVSRFHGDGVRYKAKLIGVDPVLDAQGDKMCWDSMMKLKGFEAAARKQGKHKQRVWLKISSAGVKVVDERTGAVLHEHERSRISSLTKDESDPRALAYIYQQDTYVLFYIKMSNLADPVLADIREICQSVDQETLEEPADVSAQTSSLLLLNESPASPSEEPVLDHVFSPRPDISTGQSKQSSSSDELMAVFSFQEEDPLSTTQSPSNPLPESPQTRLSTSQILSMFPVQPVGGSPYSSPPYSPTASPWGMQGPLGNQWASPATAVAPWPPVPGSVAEWAPAGVTAPPAGSIIQAHCSQPGVMWGGNAPSTLIGVNPYPTPLTSIYTPTGATALQTVTPSFDQNPHL